MQEAIREAINAGYIVLQELLRTAGYDKGAAEAITSRLEYLISDSKDGRVFYNNTVFASADFLIVHSKPGYFTKTVTYISQEAVRKLVDTLKLDELDFDEIPSYQVSVPEEPPEEWLTRLREKRRETILPSGKPEPSAKKGAKPSGLGQR